MLHILGCKLGCNLAFVPIYFSSGSAIVAVILFYLTDNWPHHTTLHNAERPHLISYHEKEIVRKCITSIKEKMALEFTQPVLSTVSAVPVQELTQFAEMLVSLTSMRRHVEDNMNLDTVGGPIDVSVITKSDGFIWINRKHYFDKELNPQYMFTHYNYGDKIVEKTKEEGDDEI